MENNESGFTQEDTAVSQQNELNFKCCICIQTLKSPLRCNVCKNHFCKKCINRWVLDNPVCPLSRCENFKLEFPSKEFV